MTTGEGGVPAPSGRGKKGSRGSGGQGFRTHFLPRTRQGWLAAVAFLALFALTQPPVVHGVANRITPWILGLPFLYAYLLGLYAALIAVLVWALRRDI